MTVTPHLLVGAGVARPVVWAEAISFTTGGDCFAKGARNDPVISNSACRRGDMRPGKELLRCHTCTASTAVRCKCAERVVDSGHTAANDQRSISLGEFLSSAASEAIPCCKRDCFEAEDASRKLLSARSAKPLTTNYPTRPAGKCPRNPRRPFQYHPRRTRSVWQGHAALLPQARTASRRAAHSTAAGCHARNEVGDPVGQESGQRCRSGMVWSPDGPASRLRLATSWSLYRLAKDSERTGWRGRGGTLVRSHGRLVL